MTTSATRSSPSRLNKVLLETLASTCSGYRMKAAPTAEDAPRSAGRLSAFVLVACFKLWPTRKGGLFFAEALDLLAGNGKRPRLASRPLRFVFVKEICG